MKTINVEDFKMHEDHDFEQKLKEDLHELAKS